MPKRVVIDLAAMTRVEYSCVVEVPDHFTREDLDEVVQLMYDKVDGGEFTEDTEYWEKGLCEHSSRDPDGMPTLWYVDENFEITPDVTEPDDNPDTTRSYSDVARDGRFH